jgi:hypothetical protein
MILEAENLERMKEGDPLDFQPRTLGAAFAADRCADLDIIIAYEEDLNTIMKYQRANDLAGLMRYLERGRRHRPGDAIALVPLRKT